ncbi:MAG: hypothetical protein GY756_24950 [bacterium]|nr:hypothetical protein [bacterium]
MKTDQVYNSTKSLILFITCIVCISSFVAFSILHLTDNTAMPYHKFLLKPSIMFDHEIITYVCFTTLLIFLYFSFEGFWKCRKSKPIFYIIFAAIFFLVILADNPIEEYYYLHNIILGHIFYFWNGFNFIGIAAVASFTFSVLHNNSISD